MKDLIIDFYVKVTEYYSYLKYFQLYNIKNRRRLKELIFSDFKVNQSLFFTGKGTIKIEKNCVFGYRLGGFSYGGSIELQPRYKSSTISIGNNVKTNNNIFICAANKITIGSNTLMGQNITIMDFEAHGTAIDSRNKIGRIGEVEIGQNVWIGNNVTILKNSFIGDNCIIATGAVVSGTFSENVIIGGVPAKIIKTISG